MLNDGKNFKVRYWTYLLNQILVFLLIKNIKYIQFLENMMRLALDVGSIELPILRFFCISDKRF